MDPVAILTLAGKRYQVASDPVDERLYFRLEGAKAWEGLETTISDGWSKISSEIVMVTNDAMFGYLRTHAMRVDETGGSEAASVEYEIEGLRWCASKTEDPEAFHIRLPGEEYGQKVRVESQMAKDWKSIAVHGLIARDKSLESRFGSEVEGWAARIAAGSSISPFFI